MYVLRNTQTGYLEGLGIGVPRSVHEILYPTITPEEYKVLVEALPGWAGDWRMVVLDATGLPESYTPRSLTPEEEASDERSDLFDKAQQLLVQIDATITSHQNTIDNWETLTTAQQIAHLKGVTQVQLKELQVLKYIIKNVL